MGTALTIGTKAPTFRLSSDDGTTVSLADFKGRKLILYFYPRADTPGCTREAVDFSRLRPQFEKAGTDILGVSADPVQAQEAFKKKHKLKIPLLSDDTHKMLEAYGAWGKKSMHAKPLRGILGIPSLIAPGGGTAQVGPKVKADAPAAGVLAAPKALPTP